MAGYRPKTTPTPTGTPPVYGLPAADRTTQALDGAIQTLALNVLEQTGRMALPTGIGRLTLAEPGAAGPWTTLFLVPTHLQIEGGTAIGDLPTLDGTGRIRFLLGRATLGIRSAASAPQVSP